MFPSLLNSVVCFFSWQCLVTPCGIVCFLYTIVAKFGPVIVTLLYWAGPVHLKANHRDKQANGKHTSLIKRSSSGASRLSVRPALDSVVP